MLCLRYTLLDGQMNSEGSALPRPALDVNPAAVSLHQVPRNDQPESAASSVGAGTRSVSTPETVEYEGQVLYSDPFTGVSHHNTDLVALRFSAERDRSTRAGVAQRIGHQVSQHLVQQEQE